MYTSWFYYILVFFTISFLIRVLGPFILPLLIVYLIYTVYKNRQNIKTMRELHKAQKTFKQEWQDVTQSKEYRSNGPSDVEDAEYSIKEEE